MTASPPPAIIHAQWIAPIASSIIRNGAIVVRGGKIVAIGRGDEIARSYPDAIEHSYDNSIILPGLINAHVHLELSDLTPPAHAGTLANWLGNVVRQGAAPGEAVVLRIARAVELGVWQCLRFGVTSAGDISQRCALTRSLLRDGPLRVVSYGEVLAMGTRRGLLEERLAVAADQSLRSETLSVGISPHAPYSVEIGGYKRCLQMAKIQSSPVATHLAESTDETQFLSMHSGPLRDLWLRIGGWDDAVPRFSGGPIRLAKSLGYLDYPRTLLAHVNACDDDELAILAGGKASVVYCPRTHAYFGHRPHRCEMLARGINVAIGTDSCGSSPDLNLVDDLRPSHQLAPNVPIERLWEMATVRAACAIASEEPAGRLSVGSVADFAIFPVASDEPLREILETNCMPSSTWIGGSRKGPVELS